MGDAGIVIDASKHEFNSRIAKAIEVEWKWKIRN
jgi:hypothetical protein